MFILVVRIPAYRHNHLVHFTIINSRPSKVDSSLQLFWQLINNIDTKICWNSIIKFIWTICFTNCFCATFTNVFFCSLLKFFVCRSLHLFHYFQGQGKMIHMTNEWSRTMFKVSSSDWCSLPVGIPGRWRKISLTFHFVSWFHILLSSYLIPLILDWILWWWAHLQSEEGLQLVSFKDCVLFIH